MIKVLLADDDTMLLDGLSSILKQSDEIELAGRARNGQEVTQRTDLDQIDVAILDIEMQPVDGLKAAAYIKGKYPDIKILMLSLHKNRDVIRQVQDLKLDGYVLKENGRDELIDAIKYVTQGENKRWFGREISEVLINSLDEEREKRDAKQNLRFTKREQDVLKLMAEGLVTKEIADQLGISHHTVETYKSTMKEKAGAKNGTELVSIAYQHDILTKKE